MTLLGLLGVICAVGVFLMIFTDLWFDEVTPRKMAQVAGFLVAAVVVLMALLVTAAALDSVRLW